MLHKTVALVFWNFTFCFALTTRTSDSDVEKCMFARRKKTEDLVSLHTTFEGRADLGAAHLTVLFSSSGSISRCTDLSCDRGGLRRLGHLSLSATTYIKGQLV